MSGHERFAEDLSLYALGTLPDAERLALEKHIDECPDCRQELAQLHGDMALMAFSVSGPTPPPQARVRLMAAIAQERRLPQARPLSHSRWWRVLEWSGAAAAMIVIVLLARQNGDLQRSLASLEASSAGQRQRLIQAEALVTSLTGAGAVRFTLVAGNTPPQPQGKVVYAPNSGTLVFLATRIPALPARKTYQLWLIPASGAPISAGLFEPDSQGSATIVARTLPGGVEARTFAITIEPEGGSPAPTSQPIMVGSRG